MGRPKKKGLPPLTAKGNTLIGPQHENLGLVCVRFCNALSHLAFSWTPGGRSARSDRGEMGGGQIGIMTVPNGENSLLRAASETISFRWDGNSEGRTRW